MPRLLRAFSLAGALAAAAVTTGAAQRATGYSAVEALALAARDLGPELVQTIVEMRGVEGRSQPPEWTFTVVDPSSPTRLRALWAGEGRATDEGVDDEWYPHRMPAGFVSRARLKLDSADAFLAADRLARAALVGFDSLDYVLRARELTDEPLWDVALVDADGHVVGRFVMSAETGAVLRLVWFRPSGREGRPTLDTLLEGKPIPGGATAAGTPGTGVVTVEPGAPTAPGTAGTPDVPGVPQAIDPNEFLKPDPPGFPSPTDSDAFPDPLPPPPPPDPGVIDEEPEVIPVPPDTP